MGKPGITYAPRPDATPDSEATALASIYRYVLDCHEKQNAASVTSTGGDDTKEGSLNDSRVDTSLPR